MNSRKKFEFSRRHVSKSNRLDLPLNHLYFGLCGRSLLSLLWRFSNLDLCLMLYPLDILFDEIFWFPCKRFLLQTGKIDLELWSLVKINSSVWLYTQSNLKLELILNEGLKFFIFKKTTFIIWIFPLRC